jgi:hypothetical protein
VRSWSTKHHRFHLHFLEGIEVVHALGFAHQIDDVVGVIFAPLGIRLGSLAHDNTVLRALVAVESDSWKRTVGGVSSALGDLRGGQELVDGGLDTLHATVEELFGRFRASFADDGLSRGAVHVPLTSVHAGGDRVFCPKHVNSLGVTMFTSLCRS